MNTRELNPTFVTASGRRLPNSNALLWGQLMDTIQSIDKVRSTHSKIIQESTSCRYEVTRNIKEVRNFRNQRAKSMAKTDYHSSHISLDKNVQTSDNTHYEAEKTAQHMLLHDLRGPLGRIAGLIQIIKNQDNLPEELKPFVDLIEEQNLKGLELTQFHAIYQQLELGCYQPRKVWFNLVELLENVQRYIQGQHYTNPVEIWVNGQPVDIARECMFFSDPQVMELMLQNLIQNAAEASPSYSAVRVEIQGRFEDEQPKADSISPITFISIHNEGMIPIAVQNRFFDKFATHGKAKGTGLGTYIAMLVAKSYGGTITFTTSEGHGTTLRVHLPGKLLI